MLAYGIIYIRMQTDSRVGEEIVELVPMMPIKGLLFELRFRDPEKVLLDIY